MIGAWDYIEPGEDEPYYRRYLPGGRYYPDVTEQESDEESFDLHYGDEINGLAVTPVDDIPSATAITNAPGQLRFSI